MADDRLALDVMSPEDDAMSHEELRGCLAEARDAWGSVLAGECPFEQGTARIMEAAERASAWNEDHFKKALSDAGAVDTFIDLLDVVHRALDHPESGDDIRLWLLEQVRRSDVSVPYYLALHNTAIQMLSRGMCSDLIFMEVALSDNDSLHRALLVSPYVPESVRAVLALRNTPRRATSL